MADAMGCRDVCRWNSEVTEATQPFKVEQQHDPLPRILKVGGGGPRPRKRTAEGPVESHATSPANPASLPQGLPVAQRGALSERPSHMAGVSSPFVTDISRQEREDARVGPRAPQPRPRPLAPRCPSERSRGPGSHPRGRPGDCHKPCR